MNRMLALAMVATFASAGSLAHARPHGDFATVIASKPVVERFEAPREHCWTQPVTRHEPHPIPAPAVERRGHPGPGPGAVLGAVVGGIIGHQFGNSSGGRDRATAAGAILGGLVGHDIDRRDHAPGFEPEAQWHSGYGHAPVAREVRRCRTILNVEERIVGHDVRYLFRGREFVTRMPYAPGRVLRVGVDVHPFAGVPRAPAYRVHVPRPAPPFYPRGY